MHLLISKLCAPTYHYNDAIRKGNKREEILQHALQIYLGRGTKKRDFTRRQICSVELLSYKMNHLQRLIENVQIIYQFFCPILDALECSLPNVLQFITGARSIPPLGFPRNITVKFKHGCKEECKCRPTSSTCDLSITLPIHYSNSYAFNEIMKSALIEGVGFGRLWSNTF